MDLGLRTPVTLVVAPAGYGKSMLVSHWAESLEGPCAWVSLDEGDAELGHFLRYVVAAIQKVVPGACEETAELLQSGQLPPGPVLTLTLANELDALDAPVVLVLDDYHRISMESGVHEFVDRLVEHPPEPLRLILTTRRDPPLSLTTLRAASRLTEVRLQDLRFTTPETAEFLATAGKITVAEGALANVQQRIEGWAVGLRLLALALRHVEGPDSFLDELRGDLPQIQEYLLSEVLAAQPPEVRERMLEASILDRFCPELLDALGTPGRGPGLMERVREHQLFTIPLDGRGEWYRYHHLLQDLLNRQLKETASTEEIRALHTRASDWFESRGLVAEAVQHALAAGSEERAAEIVEAHRDAEFTADRWYVVERWLGLLPAALRRNRPGLLLTAAWVDYCRWRMESISPLVERAAELLEGREAEAVMDGEIAFFRGSFQYWMGEGERSRQLLEEALPGIAGSAPRIEGEAELALGVARSMVGEREGAIRALEDRIRRGGLPEGLPLSRVIAGLAFVHLLSGDMPRARRDAQRLADAARRGGLRNTAGWAWYFEACTHLHALELEPAAALFTRAAELRYVLESRTAVDALAGLALTRQLLGQREDADEAAGQLRELAQELGDPEALSVAGSCGSRLALLRGEANPAPPVAGLAGDGPAPGELFLWLEIPELTHARVLVGVGSEASLEEAMEKLTVLRNASEGWRFTGQVIEISVLQALALEKQGRSAEARKALEESLGLARPGGWLRPYVEAGGLMVDMLDGLRGTPEADDVARRVTAALEERDGTTRSDAGAAVAAATPTAQAARPSAAGVRRPLEDLTNRELDILELLAQRLQNKEIADRLSISPQTVNYHLKHVYQKLEVGGRRQAVASAVEKGILGRPSGGA
jgi:LuxR family maltose regulon positive regulatory protein